MLWLQNASTGAEARCLVGLYAALKRRSSTELSESAALSESGALSESVALSECAGGRVLSPRDLFLIRVSTRHFCAGLSHAAPRGWKGRFLLMFVVVEGFPEADPDIE